MVHIYLAAAVICFQNACYPILMGDDTPIGTFRMTERLTADPGYNGNVIQFYETDKKVYAIHRLWLLNKEQYRNERLNSSKPSDHKITSGCINVSSEVFERLLDCCTEEDLKILP